MSISQPAGGAAAPYLAPRRRRRAGRMLAAGAAALVALAIAASPAAADNSSPSPSGPASVGVPSGSKTFYIGTPTDIDSQNPFSGFLSISYDVYGDTYDLLQGWALNDFSWTPGLALSYTHSDDGLTWTFKIRQGVKWSDGVDFTASDVAFTFTRAINDPAATFDSYVKNIKSVEAPDPTTAIFHMKAPDPIMSQLWVPILPEHIWSKVSDADLDSYANKDMVGTGPFQLVQYVPGQFIKLKANKNYWGGAPKVDYLVYKIYTDEDAMIQALLKGDIDAVDDISATSYNSLANAKNLTRINSYPGVAFDELAFNTGAATVDNKPVGNGAPATRDPAFRQAVAYAIDRQSIVNKVLQGYGTVGWSIIPAAYSHYAYDPGANAYTYDPVKAQQMLDAAGYTKDSAGWRIDKATGKEMNLRLDAPNSSQAYKGDLAYISGWLTAVGIKNTTDTVAEDKLTDLIGNGEVDMFVWGWGVEPDPSFQLSTMTCDQRDTGSPKSPTPGWSDSFFCNPQYDQMFVQQGQTLDLNARAVIVKNMQALLYQQVPYLVLYYNNDLEAYNSAKWTGVEQQGGKNGYAFFQYGTYSYRDVDLKSDVTGHGASGTSSSGGGSTTLWISIGAVVVVVLIGGGFMVARRRATADERE